MINFDRDRFDDMNTEEKVSFVNDLVKKNQKLTKEEIKYLVPNNRKIYFYNRIRTSSWLDYYEFNSLSDDEKELYISKKRFLGNLDLKNLSEKLQKIYIDTAISSGLNLTPEEFNLLKNVEIKKYYVKERIKKTVDTSFTAQELMYLNADEQKEYINRLIKLGLYPNVEEIKSFKPEALRYLQVSTNINEVRVIIKHEIRKILS